MKGAFSQQLLDDVEQQVTDGEVPQPRAGGAGSIFAPGSETTEIFVFPVGSALLRSEDGVNYAYIFSQPAVSGTALPKVTQTWIFDTDDGLVAPNVALIESIVSDDSIAVAGGQSDVALRNDEGVSQTNIRTDFYRLEAQYSGLAYWIVRSNAYFDPEEEYSEPDLRIGFYGLATPSSGQPVLGLAAYEGKVFGSYTAAANRFLIGGDIELLVDFDAGEVSGEASLEAYTTALVLTDPESTVVIELADGAIGSDGFFEGSDVSVKTAGTDVLDDLTAGLSPSSEDVFFRGMFTGPQAQEVVGRADLAWTVADTGYSLRFGFVAKEVEVEAEEIPEVILAKIEEDVQSGETEQPTAKPGQNFEEDTNTTVVFPTEEDEAIVRTNGGDTFVLIFEEENAEEETVVQTWTFSTTDPVQTVADNVDDIRDILGTSLAISGSRSEDVERRDSAGVEQTLDVEVYLFEGSYAGFGLWVEKPDEFFGTGPYNPGALPVVARTYGLATPSADFPSGGSASYEGKAAGVFVRNYSSGTVAASDRFTLGGDMELEVDFGNSTVGGSAELRAYTTGFAEASPASRVSIGLVNGLIDRSNVSFAGSIAITASGTGVLSGLIVGLNPVEDGFSGIFAGSEADEAVGKAEFRTGALALEFGFAAEQETSNIPLNEIAASVLADVRSKLGNDEAIAQPAAGSSSFDDTAASDYVFPSSSAAIIRSVDGSEYAYVFTSEDSVQAWRFAIGSSALNSDIVKLRTALGLGASGFSVAGSRANVVLGSIVRNIDLYVFEGSYAGLGLLVENHPEEFFGLGNYSLEDSRLELHYYGLASPQLQAGNATYIGKAAGTLVRNIRIDGTAIASDRFLVSGDVRLQARFGAGSIAGSAELTAHALDISTGSQGKLMLSISSSLIRPDGSFAGSAVVAPSTIPIGAFASFTENTQFDESSGYSGLLAGRTAQEAVGRVKLSASSTNLQFGFLATRENEAAGVTPSVVSSTRTRLDAGTTIPEQPAGSDSFAGETANDLVLPSGGGAVIRSKDGSEYAYVFKQGDSTQAWTFAVSEPGTAAAAKASTLRDLAPQEYSVSGGRDPAADGYFFERRYSGLGIWAEGEADAFFGSGSYSSADLALSIYGLATPSADIPESIAIYVGRAFGVYLKNIQNGSAAADDRFVVSGELEIEADFEQDMLGGSVQLVAHRLTGTEEIVGSSASIELAMTSVAGGDFSGNASAQLVTGVFADLNGVSLDSASGYSGFLTGPAGDELVGKALLLASDGSQRLEFGFIGEYFNIIPIEEVFLGNVEAKVLAGDEIAQPTAGSERLDSLTTAPIVFPASEGAAIVRSRDGFEFAYIFREGDPVATRTWIFSIEGLSEVSQRVSRIRGLVDTEIDVFGSRSEISRLDASDVEETLDADIYVLEIAQAGFGLVVENPEDFFGSGAYSTTGTPLAAVFYGLATPDLVAGTAVYSGSVAGGYMRNIQGDGTVAAADRFLISGDIELEANFAGGLIVGSADLTAHSLDLTTEHGEVGVGLNATISSGSTEFSGDVEITTAGTVDLIGLRAGLGADSSVFRGLIAGLDADSVAGRAEFRQAGQGLLFGFVATGQSLIPTSPIAASVRNDASTKVDAGEQIATQVAASESFASPTESDLAFRTVDGALIRSRDGSEYAYVFKQDGNLNAWSFVVGTQSVSANVANIRARLNESSINVAGSRGLVSLDSSVFNADAYIFEASYAGFGLLVQEPERFFSSESDDFPSGRVGVRHYGFESPVVGSVGFAVYEGKAAGGYVRNIKGDGTAAAADRFVLSGDIELTADLGNSTIVGSVDLIAHSLDFSATEQGKVKIGLIGLPTAGDLSIEADGEDVLEGLTAGLSADEGSGLYSSLIAGPTAQQLAGSAEFRAGNQGLLFGFIAFRETSNIPSSPIAAAVLADVNEKVDNRDSIAVPFAGSEKFDPNTPTANDVVMLNDKGSGDAVIRSKDGSEYAFVFKRFSPTRLLSWRFVSSRPAVGADIAKVRNILDSDDIRAIGSQAQVRSRDDVFAANAFIFEQSYSGAAILMESPEVFFDSSAPYSTSSRPTSASAYGLRPSAEISSGFGSYTGKAFGTYISGIADGVAQGANRYLVSGDVVLAVDFRGEGIQGSINLGAYDLSLNQAVGAAEIAIIDAGVGPYLEELASAPFVISSRTGVLSGIDDSNIPDFKFGLFSPQAAELSGYVRAYGPSSQLTFGFVATAPDVKIASSPITDAEADDAVSVGDGHKISQPQADHENFDSLTGSAFFPNNSAELLGRSRDGSEFYYSYLNPFQRLSTDENKLAFSNINVTGACAMRTELARGEGNDCTGINNASADEVFAFELSYYSFPQCRVTNAMTSKYANGDICSLDDIAIDFTFTMGDTSSSDTLIQWFFAPGSKAAADNAENIKARLGAPAEGIDVIGSRTIDSVFDSREDSIRGLLDAYFFEADYAGFGLFIFRDSDAFFGSGTYNPNRAIRARYYGLQAPSFTSSYTATYEGPAAGAYMRDISGSGTDRTVAATDRYIVTGDVELQANFATGEIAGSADLIARDLNISNANLGEVRIGLTNGSIEDSFFSGDVSIASQGTNAFSALMQGLAADNISGFRGLIAGTGAQEIAGEATFRRNNVHLLHFGFVAPNTSTTVPSWVLSTDLIDDTLAKLDADESIEQPVASSETGLGTDTPSETLVFPIGGGALVRSGDGSEFALIRKTNTFDRTSFTVTPTDLFDAGESDPSCREIGTLDAENPICNGFNVRTGDHGHLDFQLVFDIVDGNATIRCHVQNSGDSPLQAGSDRCVAGESAYVNLTENTEEVPQRNVWHFVSGTGGVIVRNIIAEINGILNTSDIKVSGARSSVIRDNIGFDVDAYSFEGEYGGFALLVEELNDGFFMATENVSIRSVAVHHYGLRTPASGFAAGGYARYEGKAAGGYMRNIALDETVAAADRFVLSGDFVLDADLTSSTIEGSVDLIAHSRTIDPPSLGTVKLNLVSTEISGGSFAGDIQVAAKGTGVLGGLTGGLTPDEGSGWYRGLLAGPDAQTLAASAQFIAGDRGLIFGLVSSASLSSFSIPTAPLVQSDLVAVKAKLDAAEAIEYPQADGTADFADAPSAEALVFPVDDGALVRSEDGTEYALLPPGTEMRTIGATITQEIPAAICAGHTLPTEVKAGSAVRICVNTTAPSYAFRIDYANNAVTCTGFDNFDDRDGKPCGENVTGLNITPILGEFTAARIWRFIRSLDPAVEANVANIETILNISDIEVIGARSNVTRNGIDFFDVDAYILESTYAGFGIWAENPEDLFDATDGTYTADELSINFYGMATPAASIPATGSASYSGKTFGIHMRDTNTDSLGYRFFISSDISASADFTDRSVSMTFGTISAYELDYTPTTSVGTAQLTAFDVSITANSSSITGKVKVADNTTGTGVLTDFTNNDPAAAAEGTISGIIAGPNFEEMAGSVSLEEGGDILKMGFIGSKQ